MDILSDYMKKSELISLFTKVVSMTVNRRAVPILVIITIALSVLPVLPVYAVSIDSLSANSGDYGDTIIVTGSGVTPGADVKVGWDGLMAWDGEKGVLNSTEAVGDSTFEVWFDVPEAVAGSHYIWLNDTDTGDTYMYPTAFTVIPRIKLSPSSGLEFDKILIKSYGFDDEVDLVMVVWDYGFTNAILTTTPLMPETDALGSWEATFKVPSGYPYGDYTVYAEDASGSSDTATFTIGATISLDVLEGPVGTVVWISGRGFNVFEQIDQGDIMLEDGVITACYILDAPVEVDSDGEFTLNIVIPSVLYLGEYEISVTDGIFWATADFDVTGLAHINVNPDFGIPGETIYIHGSNFSAITGETVSLELWDAGVTYPIMNLESYKTNSDGQFSGNFTMPAVIPTTYQIVAVQNFYNITADRAFLLKSVPMTVVLVPSSGPTGTFVTLTGVEFTAGGKWNATINDKPIFSNENVYPDGTILGTFYVLTVDVGIRTVTVLDVDTEIEITTTFNVTGKSELFIESTEAPNEYNISISGRYFSAQEGTDLEFVLYNATDEWFMDVMQGWYLIERAVVKNEDGEFNGWWEVLDESVLDVGDYLINVTDDNDLYAQVAFRVVEKTISCASTQSGYYIGDTVQFDIQCSFSYHYSYIEINDPNGTLIWRTDPFTVWDRVGIFGVVPYYAQLSLGNPLIIPNNAPLGTWSWTFLDEEDETLAQGNFTVSGPSRSIDVAFYAGWNLIGLSSYPVNPAVEDVFAGNLPKVQYVYGFDNELKEYSYWISGLPPEFQTLKEITPGNGYWVYATENFIQTIQFQ